MVVFRRVLTFSALAVAALAAAGCSADYYRHSADAQVYKLLAKRKEASLGYQPDTQIAATKDLAVPQRAYETLPVTPIPPPTPPPLATRPPTDVPYGPMGPEAKWIGVPVPKDSPQSRSAQGAA